MDPDRNIQRYIDLALYIAVIWCVIQMLLYSKVSIMHSATKIVLKQRGEVDWLSVVLRRISNFSALRYDNSLFTKRINFNVTRGSLKVFIICFVLVHTKGHLQWPKYIIINIIIILHSSQYFLIYLRRKCQKYIMKKQHQGYWVFWINSWNKMMEEINFLLEIR